uniref:Uncharacterized protein n=1 Tax=Solanum tuberosum TaxID=4113 RepID=M1DRL4_SOLTU
MAAEELQSRGNKIYSCGHPSVEFIVDKFLGENLQPNTDASNPDTDAPNPDIDAPNPDTDAPNPIVVTHQNAYVDEINKKLTNWRIHSKEKRNMEKLFKH